MNTTMSVISTTVDSIEAAEELATYLVEHRLAACVQIIPGITSIYKWQNKIQKGEEYLLQIKTRRTHIQKTIACLAERHPYDTPENIATPVEIAAKDYTEWVLGATDPDTA